MQYAILMKKGVCSMDQSLTLGERIALLRRLNGWTQMDLAIALQTDKTYVSRLETDSVKTIKSDSLIKMAQLFRVSADYILGITNELPLEEVSAKAQFEVEMEQIRQRREARKKGNTSD
jgi:transcriptional regulator with XRE-family HTH domain